MGTRAEAVPASVESPCELQEASPSVIGVIYTETLDSGTETDDEGEDNNLEEETSRIGISIRNPGMDYSESSPSSTSSTSSPSVSTANLRSSSSHAHRRHVTGTPVSAMSALGLQDALQQNGEAANKENIEPYPTEDPSGPQGQVGGAPATVQIPDLQPLHPVGGSRRASSGAHHFIPFPNSDGADGNHSSEEELEEINKFEDTLPSVMTDTPISDDGTTPTIPFCETPMQSNSSSGDETMEIGRAKAPTPVQFSTSPPTGIHVHKPRRSSSPPAKIFLAENHADSALLEQSGLGQQYAGDALAERSEERRERRRNISPRKRYRHSRQRPCLDFEKMQQ
eukprot:maker-scaffold42_size484952-snap-gene-1.15 protein:Tk06361 transcript:maker-scaffold42_size484952-snap-gene-1.15-mRNA-1 annotation:"PREDICTED: uncharacterized protein LOC100168936"